MSKIHENIVHLSVNHEGRVSLWDTQRAAMDGKEDGEIQLELLLTPYQLMRIGAAKASARLPLADLAVTLTDEDIDAINDRRRRFGLVPFKGCAQ